MKQYIFHSFLLAFIFAIFFSLGRKNDHWRPTESKKSVAIQSVQNLPEVDDELNLEGPEIFDVPRINSSTEGFQNKVIELFHSGSSREIYAQLWNNKSFKGLAAKEATKVISDRFNKENPRINIGHHSHSLAQETSARLAVLKTLDRSMKHFKWAEKKQFLRLWSKIAEDGRQHWLVRRQAYRQLLPWVGTLSNSAVQSVRGKVPYELRYLAGYSDADLLTDALHVVEEAK